MVNEMGIEGRVGISTTYPLTISHKDGRTLDVHLDVILDERGLQVPHQAEQFKRIEREVKAAFPD